MQMPFFSSVHSCSTYNSNTLDTFGDHSIKNMKTCGNTLHPTVIRELFLQTSESANLATCPEPPSKASKKQQSPEDIMQKLCSKFRGCCHRCMLFVSSNSSWCLKKRMFAVTRAEEKRSLQRHHLSFGLKTVVFKTSAGVFLPFLRFLWSLLPCSASVCFEGCPLVSMHFFKRSRVMIWRINTNMKINRAPSAGLSTIDTSFCSIFEATRKLLLRRRPFFS